LRTIHVKKHSIAIIVSVKYKSVFRWESIDNEI
jgi:hypothetical protein